MTAAGASRAVYTLLLCVLLPYALLRLAVRGIRNRGYWRHVPERFGLVPVTRSRASPRTWVHAVSVGEVVAARPVVEALLAAGNTVFLSVGTPTGRARAAALFGEHAAVTIAFAPYDLPPCVALTLARAQPARLLLMETELWPNLIAACARRGVPVVLGNARLSERSARGYARFAALSRSMLGSIAAIGAQAPADAQRLVTLGALAGRTKVIGSTKFDVSPGAAEIASGREVREVFGAVQPVVIAASTHPGEDERVLDAFTQLCQRRPGVRLIIVPRHPERFGAVADLVRQRGLQMALRSEWPARAAGAQVLVGDTMGELVALYAAADIALVCGSFEPIGGHNPIEPAALGVPILTGPEVFNFADVTVRLRDAGALRQVHASELAERLLELLSDANARERMGLAGKRFAAEGRGATVALTALLERAGAPQAEAD